MLQKPLGCSGCPLHKLGVGFSTASGTMKHGVLLVGEALGEEEAEKGLPFQGSSGQLLDRLISRTVDTETGLNLSRDDFLISNVIWCRPPDNILTGAPYEEAAISHCKQYLEKVIKIHRPKAILALGNQALRWFTKEWGIEKLRGYIWDTYSIPVIGSYHPAFIMGGKFALARVFQMDLLKALHVARHGRPQFEKEYILHPSPMDVRDYCNAYLGNANQSILAFDIETPYSGTFKKDEEIDPEIERATEDDPSYAIDRISFSYQPGRAITFPWIPPYSDYAAAMLGSSGDKAVWNRLFDVPRLEYNLTPVRGRIYDGMDAFHFLEPALPMGLKFAATLYCPDMPPWKLISSSAPEWYSAADSDVLWRTLDGVKRDLTAQGRWATFERHFVELALVLDKMTTRGIKVDSVLRAKARENFKERLLSVVGRIQPLIPIEVMPKKIFKLSAERLKKGGQWEEGRMVQVIRMEKPQHLHLYQSHPTNPLLVSCTCGKSKKAPKEPKPKGKRKKKDPSPSPLLVS